MASIDRYPALYTTDQMGCLFATLLSLALAFQDQKWDWETRRAPDFLPSSQYVEENPVIAAAFSKITCAFYT